MSRLTDAVHVGTTSGAYQVDFIVGDLDVWTHRRCTCGDCLMHTRWTLL